GVTALRRRRAPGAGDLLVAAVLVRHGPAADRGRAVVRDRDAGREAAGPLALVRVGHVAAARGRALRRRGRRAGRRGRRRARGSGVRRGGRGRGGCGRRGGDRRRGTLT